MQAKTSGLILIISKDCRLFDTFLEGDSEKIKAAIETCMNIWRSEDKDKYYDKLLRFIYGDYGNFEDRLKRNSTHFL